MKIFREIWYIGERVSELWIEWIRSNHKSLHLGTGKVQAGLQKHLHLCADKTFYDGNIKTVFSWLSKIQHYVNWVFCLFEGLHPAVP